MRKPIQQELFSDAALFPITELAAAKGTALRCQRCDLSKTRTQVVFGEGPSPGPPIFFVGEAPGENEDLQGRPFVGKAGKLLTSMIESIALKRELVYIANVVGCRPPDNRKPAKEEMAACGEFLVRQLRVVHPKTIVLLGATAVEFVLGKTGALGVHRGKWFSWKDIPTRVTYHPAYLLRNPAAKAEALDDLKAVQTKLMELGYAPTEF